MAATLLHQTTVMNAGVNQMTDNERFAPLFFGKAYEERDGQSCECGK